MRWNTGRDELERMIDRNEVQRVSPSRQMADALLSQARTHLASATALAERDPVGAYALMYDAARKALTAVMENQGLRGTTRGGHVAVYGAVKAQLDPPMGAELRPFNRMRRRRHEGEYPSTETPAITPDDVREDLPRAEKIIHTAQQVLDVMSPF